MIDYEFLINCFPEQFYNYLIDLDKYKFDFETYLIDTGWISI